MIDNIKTGSNTIKKILYYNNSLSNMFNTGINSIKVTTNNNDIFIKFRGNNTYAARNLIKSKVY